MKVYILQCLCPERHAIFGIAFAATDRAEMRRKKLEGIAEMEKAFRSGHPARRCGICGSTVLNYEAGLTPYATLAEAMPAIRREELMQIMTRCQMEERGETHDSKRNN